MVSLVKKVECKKKPENFITSVVSRNKCKADEQKGDTIND